MSILKNINYIKELSVMPCSQPDIFVLLKTGYEAAAPALLNLLVPGCTDIVKMKIGISPWHAKGIRSFIKAATPPFKISPTEFLYKIGYFHAERGLYYLMVADIAVEFAATWESFVRVAQQCQLPSAGTAYGYISPFIYGPGQEGLLSPTPIHNVPGMAIGLNGVTIFPGFQGSVVFSCTWDSWPERGQGVSVTTWIEELETGTIYSLSQTNNPASQPKNETIGHLSFDTVHYLTQKHYIFHYANTGDTYAQAIASTYSVPMSGHPSGVLPWGCKFKQTSIPFT